MDAELERAQAQLVAWGLLEVEPTGARWTRRFRAAVMRQAMRLAEEERAGSRRPGPPLLVCIALALTELAADSEASHVQVLYGAELASLPESVRAIVAPTELPLGPRG